MSDYANFKVDVPQYLGFELEAFRDKLFSLAISEPSKYFRIREQVVKHVKTEAVKNLYETIFNTLKYGKVSKNGAWIASEMPFSPSVPDVHINQIALSAAKTLNRILDEEVLDLLIPIDYKQIATKRLTLKGEANVV